MKNISQFFLFGKSKNWGAFASGVWEFCAFRSPHEIFFGAGLYSPKFKRLIWPYILIKIQFYPLIKTSNFRYYSLILPPDSFIPAQFASISRLYLASAKYTVFLPSKKPKKLLASLQTRFEPPLSFSIIYFKFLLSIILSSYFVVSCFLVLMQKGNVL